MPDPLWYCQAMLVAAIAASLPLLMASRRGQSESAANLFCLAALVVGGVAGSYLLQTLPVWPLGSGLDRCLAMVLPCAVAIEALAASARAPAWLLWLLRTCLAAASGPILLAGSVYLSSDKDWPATRAIAMLVATSGVLLVTWLGSAALWRRRTCEASMCVALTMSLIAAGMAVMLAGYIKGGAAALPWAASLAGVVLAARFSGQASGLRAAGSVALVALFGLLFVGVFFGRVQYASALAILWAPLACWIGELLPLRRQNTWIAASLRLLLVAIPLAVVLTLAKLDFDRKLGPLLGHLDRPLLDSPIFDRPT